MIGIKNIQPQPNGNYFVRIKDINMKAVATTDLLVIPASQTIIPVMFSIINTGTTGLSSAPDYSLGANGASYNDYKTIVTLTATATGKFDSPSQSLANIPTYSNTTLKLNVTTGAVATTFVCDLILEYKVI